MQERAWRRTRGEAARLAERDGEVAARERRVREEEEAVARGAHRVLPDPEGDIPSTDVEGLSPSGKRATEEEGEAGQERVEQRGRRGLPAPAQSRRRRTGAWSRNRRAGMCRRRYGGGPGRSRGGQRGMWPSWLATRSGRGGRGEDGRCGGPTPSAT